MGSVGAATTQQHVNLTLASVPPVLDYRHIKHEQLFVWHDQLADLLVKQAVIPLNRFVRFEDVPYNKPWVKFAR